MSAPWTPDWCGELVTFGGRRSRVTLACVLDPGHPTAEPHRSGTDPAVRWRAGWHPGIVDVWVEHGGFLR